MQEAAHHADANALGGDSLNGQRKFDTSLKCGPTVKISCTRSSMQMMPHLPRRCGGHHQQALRVLVCWRKPAKIGRRKRQRPTQACMLAVLTSSMTLLSVSGTRLFFTCEIHDRQPEVQL